MRRSASAVALLGILWALPARADVAVTDDTPPRGPFDRGRVHVSVAGGQQTTFGQKYFVLGGGLGYYVLDGLEVGLAAMHELGDGPSIDRISPSLRYVVQPLVGVWPLIPYAGVFYNHWFISDLPDLDTVGTRGGLLYVDGAFVLGLGVVYERTVSACTMDCASVYPDFTISLAL